MAVTKKSKRNLKRGNVPAERLKDAETAVTIEPQPHGGALRRGGIAEAAERSRERERETRARVSGDPDAALEEIHSDLTVLAQKLLRRAAREGKEPPRATMEVVREFRQTMEAVNEARKARGAVAEAAEFFADLDARLEEIAGRLEAGAAPAAEISA